MHHGVAWLTWVVEHNWLRTLPCSPLRGKGEVGDKVPLHACSRREPLVGHGLGGRRLHERRRRWRW